MPIPWVIEVTQEWDATVSASYVLAATAESNSSDPGPSSYEEFISRTMVDGESPFVDNRDNTPAVNTIHLFSGTYAVSHAPQYQSVRSNPISQTRFHGSGNVIERLMPPDRVIYFGVDYASFQARGVHLDVVDRIRADAIGIANQINHQLLGIFFHYRMGSLSENTFNICLEPLLDGWGARADSPYFPGEHPDIGTRLVRISLGVVGNRILLDNVSCILAHEFGHLLGLRHWNARSDPEERESPSVHWPGTSDGSRDTVMNTGEAVPTCRFTSEDWRALREVYSAEDGDVVRGIIIRDARIRVVSDLARSATNRGAFVFFWVLD